MDSLGNPAPIFWDGAAENTIGNGFPIVTVTGTGYSPARPHPRNARQVVEIQIRAAKLVADIPAPLYLDGLITMQTVSPTFMKEYNPDCYGTCSDDGLYDIVAPAYPDGEELPFTLKDETVSWGECGKSTSTDDTHEYPVDETAEKLRAIATERIEPGKYSNLYLGSDEDRYNIFFCDGDLELNNVDDKEGYGILVVKGNLTFGGNINWHGIIIVTGDDDPTTPAIRFNGGGSQEIRGAVMAGGDVVIKGPPDFWYDCSVLDTLKNKSDTYYRLQWKQL